MNLVSMSVSALMWKTWKGVITGGDNKQLVAGPFYWWVLIRISKQADKLVW